MNHPFMLTAVLAVSAVAAPVSAAGNLDTRGPFYELGPAGNALAMVTTDNPARVAASPVTIRVWFFHGTEQILQGSNPESPPLRFDTRMVSTRVDCGARTTTDLAYSVYAGGQHVRSQGVREPRANAARPGTTLDAIIRSVCEPGFNASRPRHADFSAARVAAARHFAQTQRGT